MQIGRQKQEKNRQKRQSQWAEKLPTSSIGRYILEYIPKSTHVYNTCIEKTGVYIFLSSLTKLSNFHPSQRILGGCFVLSAIVSTGAINGRVITLWFKEKKSNDRKSFEWRKNRSKIEKRRKTSPSLALNSVVGLTNKWTTKSTTVAWLICICTFSFPPFVLKWTRAGQDKGGQAKKTKQTRKRLWWPKHRRLHTAWRSTQTEGSQCGHTFQSLWIRWNEKEDEEENVETNSLIKRVVNQSYTHTHTYTQWARLAIWAVKVLRKFECRKLTRRNELKQMSPKIVPIVRKPRR